MTQPIVGKTLAQVNQFLLREAVRGLRDGNISTAGHLLTVAGAEMVALNLQRAVIETKCSCGQRDCETYRFVSPEKTHDFQYHTVRLHVRGELLLGIDSDGDVYSIQRLYDLSEREYTTYARDADDSWKIIRAHPVEGNRARKGGDAVAIGMPGKA